MSRRLGLNLLEACSDPINVSHVTPKLIEKENDLLGKLDADIFDSDQKLSEFMGCSLEASQTIKQYFLSELKFKSCKDLLETIQLSHISQDTNLETVKEFKKIKKSKIKKNQNICQIQPYDNIENDDDLRHEVILSISIFKSNSLKKDQEFAVLSDQILSELKDVIICQNDHVYLDDFSENPGRTDSKISKDVHKSGFFFINNTFYNDMRDASNVDYTKDVFNWIQRENKSEKEPFRSYKTARMEHTKFSELTIRLGHPYIYMHHFNCEHIISFSDIRTVQPYDAHSRLAYPRLCFRAKQNQKLCYGCGIYPARWMTRLDMLAFTDPAYFCDRCFDYLHYDENHKKVAEFKAYPYKKY